MKKRYICLHGHFYQPPRENAWLEAIELQESAYPYHDWNERITAECYAPDARCRRLDEDGRIVRIVNNFGRISFNFGPTLLSWLETQARRTYEAIIEADRESRLRFGGHGSAMAQVYNHIIMPLANRRDKITQIVWGLRDFEKRFGRPAEGMWLAETAVDLESLDLMAQHGIKFTILSPYQAARFKFLGEQHWHDANGGRIDPTRPYECRLPSGRSIALFFYDGPISQAIAFDRLLTKGEYLVGRLMGAFNDSRDWPQLVHIATDGETYGHHHKYGDMALAYALSELESGRYGVKLINYGEYLERYPPTHLVEVWDGSAWSCSHGVERWRSHCGCSSGRFPDQSWRGPLREAFDWLRDQLAKVFEREGQRLWRDPWAVRDHFIDVVLDRSPENVERFLRQHAIGPLTSANRVLALKLLEMQRHLLLMYTSCGWFFDDVSGIETVQVIQYAGRALQLGEEVGSGPLETEFLNRLARAKSNLPDHGDGRGVYLKYVAPARTDLAKAAAHYSVSSLFTDYPDKVRIYSYEAEAVDRHFREVGKARLVAGTVRIRCCTTEESDEFGFASVHFGDHHISGGVRRANGSDLSASVLRDLETAFDRADFPAVLRTLDRQFHAESYSLRSLFRDEQRRILEQLLNATSLSIDTTYRQIYQQHAMMMRFLTGLEAPVPRPFLQAAELILNHDLRNLFDSEDPDPARARLLLDEAKVWHVHLDGAGLGFALKRAVFRLLERADGRPESVALLKRCAELVELGRTSALDVDFWKAQNLYYELMHTLYPEQLRLAGQGQAVAAEWTDAFAALGEQFRIRVASPY